MKIAVITGASSGLGATFLNAVAQRCPELDEIWILARRKDRLEALAARFPARAVRPIALDLGDEAGYAELERLLAAHQPEIRVLINNAGCEFSALFAGMPREKIQAILAVNVLGLTMVQRLCLPYLHRGSFAILTCSVSSFAPVPHQAVYSASKKYVYFLGQALREELRGQGIHILLLCPGNMDTEMNPRGQARQSRAISRLPFLDQERLAAETLRRAERGSGVYTPGGFYKLCRAAGKLFPSALMARAAGKFY